MATGLPESARLLEAAEEGEAAAVGVCPDRELCGEVVTDCVELPEREADAEALPTAVAVAITVPDATGLLETPGEADKAPVKLCRELGEPLEEAVSDWVELPEREAELERLPNAVAVAITVPDTIGLPETSDEADKAPVKLCRGLNELSEEAVSD